MSTVTAADTPGKLAAGYHAVPISVDASSSPVQLCVIVRSEPDPVAGHFVVLRDTIDARVYLGGISDAQGRVHEWVELWVQDLDGLSNAVPAYVENLTNEVLDRRWAAHSRAFDEASQAPLIHTGWEDQHPAPIFIELSGPEAVHPQDPDSGCRWALCQDDQLLRDKGLPIYATSLHRYLYIRELGDDSPFVAVTAGAPTNESILPMSQLIGRGKRLVPFNPGAGLMMVRPFSPIGYETFVDVLGGDTWEGVNHGRSVVPIGELATELATEYESPLSSHGRLFLGRHGQWGRLIEAFHLKLRLVSDAIASVRSVVLNTQKPVLNLAPHSFQIRLGQAGRAVPVLWTASAALTDPGDAIALPIQSSDAEYYLPGGAVEASIYRPASAGQPVEGRGSIRIRQVHDTSGGQRIIEGTFTTQERICPARYDLVWMRANLKSSKVDLYARVEQDTAMATGEWRFRTVSQRLAGVSLEDIKAAEGVPIQDVWFEVVPLLSSPFDLYALAVLATRTLLVNHQTKLSVAFDEVLSLARQVVGGDGEPLDLPQRVRAVFESDRRWQESLGPHRLLHKEITPNEAFDLIPIELWWETLATILRMLPGAVPESWAGDYGDAQPGGIHKVFDEPLRAMDQLLVRTHSLIVIDWRFNREIHAAIRRYRTGMEQGADSGVAASAP